MSKPHFIKLNDLAAQQHENPAVWTLDFLAARVQSKFPYQIYKFPSEPEPGHDFLVVVGGGELIDYAKVWRQKNHPYLKYTVIPSIWGSGAENSPVAIINTCDDKVIHVGEEYLPDCRSIWDELAEGIPEDLVRYACGDVWAHTLEGFLSPLASGDVKSELADVMTHQMQLEIGNDPAWFELSARACGAQSHSSVGFIHGLAHTLEPIVKCMFDKQIFGHARLCSLFTWPVFRMNRTMSDKLNSLFQSYNLDPDTVEKKVKVLYSANDFQMLLPTVEKHWKTILRHPFTRTNSVLIRPGNLEQLKGFEQL